MTEETYTGQYDLRPLWTAILDVYRAYANACQKLKLQHVVECGTLLGAVRHRGFIPWDDDFDVMMRGRELDEFLANAQRLLPLHYQIVSWKNMDRYPFLFAKIMDTRKSVVDRVSRESGLRLPQGIYIDIFPCDGYPDSPLVRAWCGLRGKCLRMRRNNLLSTNAGTIKSKISMLIGGVFAPCFPSVVDFRSCMAYCERKSRAYESDHCTMSAWVSSATGSYFEIVPTPTWNDVIDLPFADATVKAPRNYEAILTTLYGDYMQLPPEDKRCLFHNWGEDVPWKYGPTGA